MIEISSSALSAAINPHGAELSHLRDADGRELMTDADPAFWRGRAPLLFPIVGAVKDGRYRLDGATYAMPKHGFARRQMFELAAHEDARAVFRLTDTDETRTLYPFAFVLEAEFRIEGATLMMMVRVANAGDTDMPASFGFHPAFAWPLPYGEPRAAHRIRFEQDESSRLNGVSEDGLLLPAERESPLDRGVLHLEDSLFEHDALVWERVQSRAVTYGAEHGPQLHIAFPNMPMLGIWTKPGARYVCVEPWQGHADPVGFGGEFWDKPGMLRIAPGESRTFEMRVTLRG